MRSADPVLRGIDVEVFVRQLAAIGRIETSGARTDDLMHRDLVHRLADGLPTAMGDLAPAARDVAAIAAGCLIAVRPET